MEDAHDIGKCAGNSHPVQILRCSLIVIFVKFNIFTVKFGEDALKTKGEWASSGKSVRQALSY